ncbi:protein of unknown function [Hyphomicrobium sp. MC1]|nr:protein of unknown function [Hyphomicrobium sp. MC1]
MPTSGKPSGRRPCWSASRSISSDSFFVTVHIALFALPPIYDPAVVGLKVPAAGSAEAGLAFLGWINGKALIDVSLLARRHAGLISPRVQTHRSLPGPAQ